MLFDTIEIDGLKSIQSARVGLRPLNVLIGANGSGKSNFVAAFALLNQITEGQLQLAVARGGGASSWLRHGPKVTPQMRLRLSFGQNTYDATLEHAEGDTLFFANESCTFLGPGYATPYRERLGAGHKESELPGEAKKHRGGIAEHVLHTLRRSRAYHFHDTSSAASVKQKGPIGDNASLRADAGNLAAFLFRLENAHPEHYRRIVETVRSVAPFFDTFQLAPDGIDPQRIQLEWRERGSDGYFNAHAMSDGTLRFACLAALLLQPERPGVILLDEPELGLHPFAIQKLAAMLQSASTDAQVIVSTQSVTLIDQVEPRDVIVVDRADGQSTFRRIGDAEVAEWMDDYSLGELWEKNVLGGRPQRA